MYKFNKELYKPQFLKHPCSTFQPFYCCALAVVINWTQFLIVMMTSTEKST